jgi:hypothetical protein
MGVSLQIFYQYNFPDAYSVAILEHSTALQTWAVPGVAQSWHGWLMLRADD